MTEVAGVTKVTEVKAGKLTLGQLNRLVLNRKGKKRADVLLGASAGEDSAVLDFGGQVCVVSTDPITGADAEGGWLAVHVSCNDVAACGAEPVAVLLTLLLPEGTDTKVIESIMDSASRAANEVGVEIAGGHTEVTPGLTKVIINSTVIGRAPADRWFSSGGASPGDDIVITKTAGLEGAAILAYDYGAILEGRVEAGSLAKARDLGSQISVVKEASVAASHPATTGMHDVTEGGVLGALYEMAEASSTGLLIDAARVPLWPEVRDICSALGIDPFRLISSGALIVTTSDGEGLVRALEDHGTEAAVIGCILPENEGRWIETVEEDLGMKRQEISPPESDELWRIKSQLDAT